MRRKSWQPKAWVRLLPAGPGAKDVCVRERVRMHLPPPFLAHRAPHLPPGQVRKSWKGKDFGSPLVQLPPPTLERGSGALCNLWGVRVSPEAPGSTSRVHPREAVQRADTFRSPSLKRAEPHVRTPRRGFSTGSPCLAATVVAVVCF